MVEPMRQKEGAKRSFRYVSACARHPGDHLRGDRRLRSRRGGYKPEELDAGKELTPAELASDY